MELDQQDSRTVIDAARFALARWSEWLGESGIEAMRQSPGLAAAVDQHAAQIREAIGEVRPETLAAYADGVADTVIARGWSADETGTGWNSASWPSLHLLAVCVLARNAG